MGPWSILLWWLVVLVARLLKTISNLTVGAYEGILATRDSLEDIVAKVLHEHLLLAFHILDDNVRNVCVSVLMEGVLILHNT